MIGQKILSKEGNHIILILEWKIFQAMMSRERVEYSTSWRVARSGCGLRPLTKKYQHHEERTFFMQLSQQKQVIGVLRGRYVVQRGALVPRERVEERLGGRRLGGDAARVHHVAAGGHVPYCRWLEAASKVKMYEYSAVVFLA